MVGIGTFIVNEIITGNISEATAIVKSWNSVIGEMQISNTTGNFTIGETIVGSSSSAVYELKSIQEYNTVNQYPQNNEIELESNDVLDFSESNPFGNP